jgi:integrase
MVTGRYVSPRAAKISVNQWCDVWLDGYGSRRASTVRQARTHLAQIRSEFGHLPLTAVRPSAIRSWLARLTDEGYAPSYVFALHNRLSQIMTDAALDNLIAQNPCSRRTSPGAGKQRAYVATTEQVWALHDAFPARLRVAVLLGAFAGLRNAEACGLRTADVAFLQREIRPTVQYPSEPLKTDMSRTPVPVADTLLTEVSAHLAQLARRHGPDQPAGRAVVPVAATAGDAGCAGPGGGAGRRLPVPRSAALLREPADRVGCRREGGPASPSPREREDDAGHLRAPLAGLRRVHTVRSRARPIGASCGLCADWTCDVIASSQVSSRISAYMS